MKILHVIAQLPEQTGSGVYFRNMVTGFNQMGVKNALIFAFQSPMNIDIPALSHFPVEFNQSALPFPIVGMSDVMPYPSTRYQDLTADQLARWQEAFRTQLNNAKNKFQPDVIISHHLWYLTSLVLDCFPDKPVIGISHGTDVRQARLHPNLKQHYVTHLNRLSLVFALTAEDKINLVEVFKIDQSKIQIMGNSYNDTIFYPVKRTPHPLKRIVILFAGKITRSKGVFELLEAYAHLKKEFPQLELWLFGNGDLLEIEGLKNCAHQLGVNNSFHCHSLISQQELAHFMQQADLFVLPSYYEGLATICIEAMACGLRAVVSNLLPLKNFLGDSINQSGWIEYVQLPRLIDQDQALPDDLPAYTQRLINKMKLQIQRIIQQERIDPLVQSEIKSFAWSNLIKKQWTAISSLLEN